MTKIRPLIQYIIVALPLVGIVCFQTIREVFFPPPALETATEVAGPKSETSRLDGAHSKGPSSNISATKEKPIVKSSSQRTQLPPKQLRDAQSHREELADKASLRSTERLQANTELTELERLQREEQRLLEEQAEQEAADYEASLRSTERPRANTELTELEKLQLEEQRLLEEQAEQEAADYEQSLQSSSFDMPKR